MGVLRHLSDIGHRVAVKTKPTLVCRWGCCLYATAFEASRANSSSLCRSSISAIIFSKIRSATVSNAACPCRKLILLATDIESGDAPALCERFVA
jgi:hypothetical protein